MRSSPDMEEAVNSFAHQYAGIAGFDLSSERYRQWLPDGWVIDQPEIQAGLWYARHYFRR